MDKFSLKWNDFNSNVQKSFRNLRTEDDFFDITLVGDVYKHVTAHKVVLSSCSEYFKGVFSNNKKHTNMISKSTNMSPTKKTKSQRMLETFLTYMNLIRRSKSPILKMPPDVTYATIVQSLLRKGTTSKNTWKFILRTSLCPVHFVTQHTGAENL